MAIIPNLGAVTSTTNKGEKALRVVQSEESNALISLIDNQGDVIYLGEALPDSLQSDPVWKIRKVDLSGSVITILFADSNNNLDNVWDDRETLTYG